MSPWKASKLPYSFDSATYGLGFVLSELNLLIIANHSESSVGSTDDDISSNAEAWYLAAERAAPSFHARRDAKE